MAFEKYTTDRLKKYQKTLLIIGILGLILMCFALGFGIYQMTHHDSNTIIFLVPTVFSLLAILPSLVSDSMSRELKRREGICNNEEK